MTISDARSFIRPVAAKYATRDDVFAHQAILTAYLDSDEAKQRDIRGAMQVLLFDGDGEERQMSAQFFVTSGAAGDVLQRAAEQFARSPNEALATLLRDAWAIANPETVKVLRALFLQNPAANARVAKAVLSREPDGETWQRVVQLVKDSDDAQVLKEAFDLSFVANKRDEFVQLMRGKPEAVIRAVGEKLSVESKAKLLALIP